MDDRQKSPGRGRRGRKANYYQSRGSLSALEKNPRLWAGRISYFKVTAKYTE